MASGQNGRGAEVLRQAAPRESPVDRGYLSRRGESIKTVQATLTSEACVLFPPRLQRSPGGLCSQTWSKSPSLCQIPCLNTCWAAPSSPKLAALLVSVFVISHCPRHTEDLLSLGPHIDLILVIPLFVARPMMEAFLAFLRPGPWVSSTPRRQLWPPPASVP